MYDWLYQCFKVGELTDPPGEVETERHNNPAPVFELNSNLAQALKKKLSDTRYITLTAQSCDVPLASRENKNKTINHQSYIICQCLPFL